MKKILHISYDLRDRYDRKVTPAISRLIDLSKEEFDTFTIDLVRTPNPLNENMKLISPDHLKINAFGFPFGILMNRTQNRVVEFISKASKKNMIDLSEISLIHSHKMSFEGLVGYKLSLKHDIPLVITLRQTDAMVINRKPGAIRTFKPVIKRCKKIFYLIPQILIRMEELLGENFFRENMKQKAVFLPNIVERQVSEDKGDQVQKGHFVTVLKMNKRIVRRKNIKKLLKAFSQLKNYEVTLTIVGDGEYRNVVERWVRKYNLVDKVVFAGNIPNDQIDIYYKRAEAFLLPSFSESFGLVYAEALLNGTPIMFSKGYLGFDGFYDGVGVGVNPRSIKSIADGIIDLNNNGEVYRKNIKELSEAGEFNIFNSKYIGKKYIETINEIC